MSEPNGSLLSRRQPRTPPSRRNQKSGESFLLLLRCSSSSRSTGVAAYARRPRVACYASRLRPPPARGLLRRAAPARGLLRRAAPARGRPRCGQQQPWLPISPFLSLALIDRSRRRGRGRRRRRGMPKNKGKGGKNRKRGKNEADDEKRELVFKEDGQEYAQVARMLGNGRCEAQCIDGIKRLCHIRGKMTRRSGSPPGTLLPNNQTLKQITRFVRSK
ncbi:hypothetical protein GUJ93_ZPchr0075g2721 [Zizania palustris]|uniref:Eukaryotic translation initiation factor 4C n=1 Tax=Zizania palustris TaxID=103762 RepID=A0A8J5VES1_ZIZPA|nr:hypothetical protein GUJ93_ZPchr0075g2721 [Zizania palustris]